MARISDPSRPHDVKPMDKRKSILQDVLTWGIPALILSVLGYFIGDLFKASIGFPFFLLSAWTLVHFGIGLMFVQQQCFIVYERFGRFHSVKFHGIRWKNWILDKERLRESFKVRDFDLYSDQADAQIDFTDATAPITATAWYSIGDPVDVAEENWDSLERQVALWTYRYNDPRERVSSLLDSALRPRLQSLSIDEAQKLGDKVCADAVEDASPNMAAIGAFPARDKALVLEDIALPPEVVALREKRLQGEAAADEAEAELQGPMRAVRALQAAAIKDGGEPLPYKAAYEMVMQGKILDTIANTKANISFVAPNVEGVIKTVSINPKES